MQVDDRPITRNEILYQLILLTFLLLTYSLDQRLELFDWYRIPFFLCYMVAGLLIGFIALPRYYYKGQYRQFAIVFILCLLSIILVEEFILEKIFYPDTRGAHFHGFFYSILETAPMLALVVSIKFAWDLSIKNQQIAELQSYADASELRYLKSQINPHFLFNNLNNLYSYSLYDQEKTSEVILELSSVLRYMLYDCQERWVPLDKELHHITNFVNLSKMQIEDRGQVDISIQNKGSGLVIAPLILMVFIENAFKHSQSSISEGINITLSIHVDEQGVMQFQCTNNYEQLNNNDNLASGIGLENVQKRLDLIYPGDHELSISKGDEYYTVNLQLQLNAMKP